MYVLFIPHVNAMAYCRFSLLSLSLSLSFSPKHICVFTSLLVSIGSDIEKLTKTCVRTVLIGETDDRPVENS